MVQLAPDASSLSHCLWENKLIKKTNASLCSASVITKVCCSRPSKHPDQDKEKFIISMVYAEPISSIKILICIQITQSTREREYILMVLSF